MDGDGRSVRPRSVCPSVRPWSLVRQSVHSDRFKPSARQHTSEHPASAAPRLAAWPAQAQHHINLQAHQLSSLRISQLLESKAPSPPSPPSQLSAQPQNVRSLASSAPSGGAAGSPGAPVSEKLPAAPPRPATCVCVTPSCATVALNLPLSAPSSSPTSPPCGLVSGKASHSALSAAAPRAARALTASGRCAASSSHPLAAP